MVVPKNGQRISKEDAYLNCAETFAYRSTCIKRKYGAVIVKDDAVISTGYNGSPRGYENCCDIGHCPRIPLNMHQGQGYDIGADLYLTGINPEDCSIHPARPCPLCARLIIQAGIRNVILRQGDGAGRYIVVPAENLKWHS